jgi:hypothetical protein
MRPRWAHGKGRGTAMPRAFFVHQIFVVRSGGPLSCSFLCCALSSVVVMNRFFAVRLFLSLSWPDSLPCAFLSAHDKEVFVVRAHTTKMAYTAPLFFP